MSPDFFKTISNSNLDKTDVTAREGMFITTIVRENKFSYLEGFAII
jgi:hypothetical protein